MLMKFLFLFWIFTSHFLPGTVLSSHVSPQTSVEPETERQGDSCDHTPIIAFRHLPPKEGRRKPALGVWVVTAVPSLQVLMWAIQVKETRPLNWMVTDRKTSFVFVPCVVWHVSGISGWAMSRMFTREILGSVRNCVGNVGLWWTYVEDGEILYVFVKRRLRCVETPLMELLCMCLERSCRSVS